MHLELAAAGGSAVGEAGAAAVASPIEDGKEREKRLRLEYAAALSKLQSSMANVGRTTSSPNVLERLWNRLAQAEAAAAAVISNGVIPDEAREYALRRTGLDGFAVAQIADKLSESRQKEVERFIALTEPLDDELRGIATAVSLARRSSPEGLAGLGAIAKDRARTVRARLHAAWWLMAFNVDVVTFAAAAQMLVNAAEESDWYSAAMCLRALGSIVHRKRASEWSSRKRRRSDPERWPNEEMDDDWKETAASLRTSDPWRQGRDW